MIDNLNIDYTDGIATLTIERPRRRNALHAPLWTGIREAAAQIKTADPRAVIICGTGDHFCAGMDLNPDNPLVTRLLSVIGSKDEAGLIALIEELKSTFESIIALKCPVIAAIEGACVGGGLELALACDIRIASDTAFFALPETKFGMVPDLGGTVRLAQTIGVARATEFILAAQTINAKEAMKLGLLNRVVSGGQAMTAARELATEIQKNSPAANQQTLGVLRQLHNLSEASALRAESEAGATALLSFEVMEGVQAFIEKRAPNWNS